MKWQLVVLICLGLVLGYMVWQRDAFDSVESLPSMQPLAPSMGLLEPSSPVMQPLGPPEMLPIGPSSPMAPLSPAKNKFDPSGNDLCTWFVNGYDNMPAKYQEIVYSACKDYQNRCTPGQVWGELHSIQSDPNPNFAKMASKLNTDDCAPLVKCTMGPQCISYYTGTHCVGGYCN